MFSYVGENLAITNSPIVNYTNMARDWFDERDVYNYQTRGCEDVCGHYTQVNVHVIYTYNFCYSLRGNDMSMTYIG